MFRRIVTYLVCWSIAFHPVAVQASDTEVTVLLANKAYAAQVGDTPVQCLDVKKNESGQVRLSFDNGLHNEGLDFLLVLEKKPVGQVFFKNGQLNFWGYEGSNFSLEADANYSYPLLRAEAHGNLTVAGGQFNKDSIFIANNLSTTGAFNGNCSLSFKATGTLDFKGTHTLAKINLISTRLLLDAIADAADIRADAARIEEAATSKLYASDKVVFSGYKEGFLHNGAIKAKDSIYFEGGAYTGVAGSTTLAGGLFQNQSSTIDEAGRLAASIGYMLGDQLTFQDPFNFTGIYFLTDSAVSLDTKTNSWIEVQKGAQLLSKGTLNNLGRVNHVGSTSINFPCMDLFGHGTFVAKTAAEDDAKQGEIRLVGLKLLPKVNFDGLLLKAGKTLNSTGRLLSGNASITIDSPDVKTGGTIISGFFDGLVTHIKSKSTVIEGEIRAHTVISLIDQYVKLNGLMVAKHREIVFAREDVNAQVAAQAQKPKVFEMGSGANLVDGSLSIQHADSANLDAGVAKLTNLYIDAKETVQKAANELTIEQTAGFTGEIVKLGGSLQTRDLVATPTKEVAVEETGKVNASGTAQYKTEKMTVAGQTKAGVSVTEVATLIIPEGGDLQGHMNIVDAKDATADGHISGDSVQATFDDVTQGAQGSIKGTKQVAINVVKEGTFGGENDAPTVFLQGKKVTVATTGGVTGKEVIADVKQLIEEKGAVVAGSELTDIKSVDAKLDGETGSTETNLNISNKLETGKDSKTKGTKQLVTNAKEWDHKGKTDAGHHFSKTQETKIAKGAKVNSTQSTQMEATKGFDNAGVIDTQGAARLKTPTDKVGVVKTKKGLTLEPKKKPDVKGIFAGKHRNLKDNPSVTLIVKDDVTVTESPKAEFGTGLVANSIKITTDIVSKKPVYYQSTIGDINAKSVKAPEVDMISKKGLKVEKVTFKKRAHLESGKAFTVQEDFTGRGQGSVKAPSITVLHGVNMEANVLLAEATAGSIRNGGTMRGRKYLERKATGGDVVEEGYWTTSWDGKRRIPLWTPARAIGGTGIPIKIGDKIVKVGLMSQADGKVRNVASFISTAPGASIINNGKKGLENLSQHKTYLAKSKTKRSGLFGNKKSVWRNIPLLFINPRSRVATSLSKCQKRVDYMMKPLLWLLWDKIPLMSKRVLLKVMLRLKIAKR